MTNDPFQHYAEAFGDRLKLAEARQQRRRRKLRAGALVTAVVALAAIVGLALPGGRSLDPVAEARAALGGPNDILHFTAAFSVPGQHQRCAISSPTEIWMTTGDPSSYRLRWSVPGNPCGIEITDGRRVTGVQEIARADGVESDYSESAHLLTRTTGLPATHGAPDLNLPATRGVSSDPVVALRELLAAGTLHDEGTTILHGRQVRRLNARVISRAPAIHRKNKRGTLVRLTGETTETDYRYLVDAQTFVPVQLLSRLRVLSLRNGVRPRKNGMLSTGFTTLETFLGFQRLPLTPESAKLLTIQPPAGTRTRTKSVQALRAKRLHRHIPASSARRAR